MQTLIIRDNNILLIPGSALGRIPKLSNLYLDFNRIAALSADILGSIEPETIRYLSLSRNIIRELPAGTFKAFSNLVYLDLSLNSLVFLSAEMFAGLEHSLIELKLSANKLSHIGNIPLGLRNLRRLDLSQNNLQEVSKEALNSLDYLVYLNISHNTHLTPFHVDFFHSLPRLHTIDLSNTGIEKLTGDIFANNLQLRVIRLAYNHIQEVDENTFYNLRNLTEIDLSYNRIITFKPASFVNVMNLKKLYLKSNQINAFKGEIFNTGTGLEVIDLSENKLSYIFPSAFRIHPRLKQLLAVKNKLSFFPAEHIQSLHYLEEIDLSHNLLTTIDELDFARLPRLRKLSLAHNLLDTINEMAFHNSTQLQILNLSNNKLNRLGERTFEGLVRLQDLNLENNELEELPDNLFETHKLKMLEKIDLSHNKFEKAPLRALEQQSNSISIVDLGNNQIRDLDNGSPVLINIKYLDLSYNPLSKNTIVGIFSEPKTVRHLNLAGIKVTDLPVLETPYLQYLNLSYNQLKTIRKDTFGRTSLLESLDISNNKVDSFKQLSEIWNMLPFLKHLDLSNNSFEMILKGDLDHLQLLDSLKINDLLECTRIEKMAFKQLPSLSELIAFNFPRLGYLDVQGILQELPSLQKIDIEVKDSYINVEQIQPSNHPRLKQLFIRGHRLKTISSSILAGFKSKQLMVAFKNTSLTILPPAILFAIPRSSKLELDISGSMITAFTPQLLNSFEDRRNSFILKGLNTNPIHCDCNSRTLRRWLPHAKMENLLCFTPENLRGRLLIEIGDSELICDEKKTTFKSTAPMKFSEPVQTQSTFKPSNYEPEIIWQSSPSPKLKTKLAQIKQSHIGNDDTLIIAIVGGVVIFIVFLILFVCIVRCRSSVPNYMRNPIPILPNVGVINGAPSSTAIYTVPPYAQSYTTLQHKPQLTQSQMRLNYTTMNSRHSAKPFVIYNGDEKSFNQYS